MIEMRRLKNVIFFQTINKIYGRFIVKTRHAKIQAELTTRNIKPWPNIIGRTLKKNYLYTVKKLD